MKNIISFKRASQISLVLFGIMALAHFCLIIGIVFFDYVRLDILWGGRMETKEQLLVFEIVSFCVTLFCIFVVLVQSERLKAKWFQTASRISLWILFVLFLLNTVGNIIAKSSIEKSFAIITLLLAFLCLRMAMKPSN